MTDDSTEGRPWGLEPALWRKSTFSAGGECVTAAEVDSEVAVRNSNDPTTATLFLDGCRLVAGIRRLKADEFDLLTSTSSGRQKGVQEPSDELTSKRPRSHFPCARESRHCEAQL
jgi:hypothetical protein